MSNKLESQVDHPKHYNSGCIEVIDAIEDWNLGFNLGNVVKYVARSEYKGAPIQDLEKALWYLTREIQKRKRAELISAQTNILPG